MALQLSQISLETCWSGKLIEFLRLLLNPLLAFDRFLSLDSCVLLAPKIAQHMFIVYSNGSAHLRIYKRCFCAITALQPRNPVIVPFASEPLHYGTCSVSGKAALCPSSQDGHLARSVGSLEPQSFLLEWHRPSFAEVSVSKTALPFQSSIRDHLLVSYQASFISICTAQFGKKRLADGVEVQPRMALHGPQMRFCTKPY